MTYVINFISRNKDNANIEGFKPRSKSFLTEGFLNKELDEKFKDFIEKGMDGEFSRFYVSINRVDETKVKKELARNFLYNIHWSFGNHKRKYFNVLYWK